MTVVESERQNFTAEIFEVFALTVPFRTAPVEVTPDAARVLTVGVPVLKERIDPKVVP